MPNYLQHIYHTTTKRGKVVAVLDEPITTQDHDADAFIVTVSDAVFSGGRAYGDFVRADGVTIPLSGSVSGDTATVILAPNCYTVPGRFFLTVKVEASGSKTTYLQVEGYAKSSSTDEFAVAGDDSAPIDMILEAAEKAEQVLSAVADKAPAIYVDASGDVVQIADGAEGMPVKGLKTTIVPKEDCIGWDAVAVKHTGINILQNGEVERTATMIWYATKDAFSGAIGERIAVSFDLYSAGGTAVTVQGYQQSGLSIDGTYTITPQAGTWQRHNIKTTIRDFGQQSGLSAGQILIYSPGGEVSVKNVQVEFGVTATPFEPYNGENVSAALPETVYSGTLDWVSGVLTVTHAVRTLDGTESTWSNYSAIGGCTVQIGAMRTSHAAQDFWCDIYPTARGSSFSESAVMCGYNNSNYLYWQKVYEAFGVADLAGWKAYLQDHPAKIVYPLAEPYTIQLTPQQLDTLKGTNNIWSDAGATEVTYAADTKMYIDQKIAAIAAAIV